VSFVLACGPFVTDLDLVRTIEPASRAAYARGDLGVVRPRFARRYLVQAYRVLAGRPPLANAVPPSAGINPDPPAPEQTLATTQWIRQRDEVLGAAKPPTWYVDQWKRVGDSYQGILNCPDDAFTTAVRTLKARQDRYGAASAQVRDWTRAQAAVFANCSDDPLTFPEPAPAGADPLVLADRAYQTAAAYFYAMQYAEAGRRFLAIAADRTSPWQPYGRYLAARSTIRQAMVPKDVANRTELLANAQAELRAIVADAGAASLHSSARGLLDFIEARQRPIERLHAVSRRLTTAQTVADQEIVDYRWLMDSIVGDTVDYAYPTGPGANDTIQGDDLTDWVLAIQGGGQAAADRAIRRWQDTHAAPWLVAVLWRAAADHPIVPAALEAAAAVERTSPAYPTVSFLRVRTLARLGRRDEARALLASLPTSAAGAFDAEAVNLLNGERVMLARTFDEFLASAPRTIVVSIDGKTFDQPSFDEDAAAAFSDRLPLDRLVEASLSDALPRRLRLRVAIAALTRAVVLRRDDVGVKVAAVVRDLAPPTAADIAAYVAAPDAEERHRAGLLLLLRTPGMHLAVQAGDTDVSYDVVEPERTFDHLFRVNWWCARDPKYSRASELTGLLYADGRTADPSFVTATERGIAERENGELLGLGAGATYLAEEAIAWARARPKDARAAEALAHVVEGWRWRCGYNDRSDLPRQAFTTLHRLFPQSEWAKRTKYWYQ